MRQIIYIPEEELREMYLNKRMSMNEIANALGVSYTTVSKRMVRYKIASRSISESMPINPLKLSKEELSQMYLDNKMSLNEIAIEVNVSNKTISSWMNGYGIETRTISESKLGNSAKLSKEELMHMYWDDNMSTTKIGLGVGVTSNTILNWMAEYDIETRDRLESVTGENHPNWKGGISIKYCEKFDDILREAVRERDNHRCQNCGKNEYDDGRKLSVHHIHYDKSDCYPDLLTLCKSCHASSTAGNRDEWEELCMIILADRGLLNWRPSWIITDT